MKKIMFVLVALMLAAVPVTVYADGGITNNPNHFELNMNCDGEMILVTIPNAFGMTPGFTDDGRIAHPRTHKIDFEQDGEWDVEFLLSQGKGFDTVLCTWTWENDPYLHGMDVQFTP